INFASLLSGNKLSTESFNLFIKKNQKRLQQEQQEQQNEPQDEPQEIESQDEPQDIEPQDEPQEIESQAEQDSIVNQLNSNPFLKKISFVGINTVSQATKIKITKLDATTNEYSPSCVDEIMYS